MRIAPPGDEGLCSVPLGTTNVSPVRSTTVVSLPAASRMAMSNRPSRTREELVGIVVDVPDMLASGVRDPYVVVVHAGHDPRAVDVVEGRQRVGQVDGCRIHTVDSRPHSTRRSCTFLKWELRFPTRAAVHPCVSTACSSGFPVLARSAKKYGPIANTWRRKRVSSPPTGYPVTVNGSIMSLSSCSTMWQWCT